MASTYIVGAADEGYKKINVSPKTIKRTWSNSTSPTFSHVSSGQPKCVCSPSTHAGSFKCRLHRANSLGHSHSPPASPLPPAATAPSSKEFET